VFGGSPLGTETGGVSEGPPYSESSPSGWHSPSLRGGGGGGSAAASGNRIQVNLTGGDGAASSNGGNGSESANPMQFVVRGDGKTYTVILPNGLAVNRDYKRKR